MSQNGHHDPPFRDQHLDSPRPVLAHSADHADGARIRRHRHARHQLLYAASGVMAVDSDAGRWVVPPQFAVWVPAGTGHALVMHGDVRMRTIYVATDARADLSTACRVLQVTPLMRALILRAMTLPRVYDEAGPQGRLLAVLLDELAALPPAPLHLPLPGDSRARAVADALQAAPDDRRSLAGWAVALGVGERTLARLFLRETGLSFGAWRRRARIMHALTALTGGAAVTTVAFDCGYDSVSAFIAAFRRELGASPGRYVAAAGEEPAGVGIDDRA